MHSMGIVLAGWAAVRAYKEKTFLFGTKQKVIMGALVLIVAVSLYVNKDIMADPRNANISSDYYKILNCPCSHCFLAFVLSCPKH